MNRLRLLLVLLILTLVAVAAWLDLPALFSLDNLRWRYAELQGLVARNFIGAATVFFLAYAVLGALSVPGAALVLTLAAGALFGVAWGSLLVSFASSLGALAAFLISRFLLRELIERRFPYAIERVNAGIREDGAYYLFGLRLVPVFPYFVINLVMGLTRLPARTYYWVSQVGMLPATFIYVNAGTRLGEISSGRDILSAEVALSLAALGVFPLVARRVSNAVLAWHRGRA